MRTPFFSARAPPRPSSRRRTPPSFRAARSWSHRGWFPSSPAARPPSPPRARTQSLDMHAWASAPSRRIMLRNAPLAPPGEILPPAPVRDDEHAEAEGERQRDYPVAAAQVGRRRDRKLRGEADRDAADELNPGVLREERLDG